MPRRLGLAAPWIVWRNRRLSGAVRELTLLLLAAVELHHLDPGDEPTNEAEYHDAEQLQVIHHSPSPSCIPQGLHTLI